MDAAPVASLAIVTVDKTIYLEEPPEVLSLKAYDDEGTIRHQRQLRCLITCCVRQHLFHH